MKDPHRGGRRRWSALVTRRWPSALAIGSAALIGGGGPGQVFVLGEILLLLGLVYLLVAQVRRPGAAWPALVAGVAAIAALRSLDVPLAAGFAAVGLGVLVWGAVDGQLREPGMFRVEAAGMLGFGALAFVALTVEPDLARYLVAAGWFAHGVWDVVHLRLNRVVVRSYAEWCGLVDILVAAQLVLVA